MINCIVVDDEPIARKGLLEHINRIDFLTPVAECRSAMEAAACLHDKKVDLIYLDIQMPDLTGIDFIKNSGPLPPVILTTAFPEYAVEGFELDILDYLLKPVSYPRFLKSAFRAQEFISMKTMTGAPVTEDFFFIKCNQKIEKILMADVLYIEGMSNYIIVHTAQKKYIAYLTFKGIEEKLPDHLFIRIHKSFLVSISAVQSIDANEVKLGSIMLPLSKVYKEQVMNRIDSRFFKR
jgi:DNA-binding LytR/AlgR family response regulator